MASIPQESPPDELPTISVHTTRARFSDEPLGSSRQSQRIPKKNPTTISRENPIPPPPPSTPFPSRQLLKQIASQRIPKHHKSILKQTNKQKKKRCFNDFFRMKLNKQINFGYIYLKGTVICSSINKQKTHTDECLPGKSRRSDAEGGAGSRGSGGGDRGGGDRGCDGNADGSDSGDGRGGWWRSRAHPTARHWMTQPRSWPLKSALWTSL